MNIEVYVSNDLQKFGGNIDGKEFDFTVEEFMNLIGAFQQAAAKAQNVELPPENIVSAKAALDMENKG